MFFFFQAEDGIRDWSVTGVQTCALPIFKEVVPMLEANPKLAFVQAPQKYVNTENCPVAQAAQFQQAIFYEYICERSEERRVGKGVDLGGRRRIKKNREREWYKPQEHTST